MKEALGSRPTRARGLKLDVRVRENGNVESRPTRARGLKLYMYAYAREVRPSRAPRGRVD